MGGWLLKAAPGVWDLEAALAAGEVPTSWRVVPSYRVAMMRVGDPVVLWRTRGWSGPAGVVAAGWLDRPSSGGRPPDPTSVSPVTEEVPGDPGDPRWRDLAARDRPRPRVHLTLEVLPEPVTAEAVDQHGGLENLEVRRAPRIANPSVLTPTQWSALESLF